MTKIPLFIASGDWHLMDKTPVCRIDDSFQTTMWNKVKFITDLSYELDIPIILGGDVFDSWRGSLGLLHKAFSSLANIYTIAGNHDLFGENFALIHKTLFGMMDFSDRFTILGNQATDFHNFNVYGQHFGQTIMKPYTTETNVAVIHEMVWNNIMPYPGLDNTTNVNSIMKKYKEFDIIVSSHNHIPFATKRGRRLLVNPGSILRLTSAAKDIKPRIYIVYSDMTVKPIFIPIVGSHVSDEHIEKKKEIISAVDKFIQSVKIERTEEIIPFEEYIQRILDTNEINPKIRKILIEVINISDILKG